MSLTHPATLPTRHAPRGTRWALKRLRPRNSHQQILVWYLARDPKMKSAAKSPEPIMPIAVHVVDGGTAVIVNDGHRLQELSAGDARKLHAALAKVMPELKL